ncbi:hypothetical protein [Nitrosomonas sp.]|uniref:hypothetical protein n=1 Tax=Nitrosomonas sp. TaxID=42353 RepID=UPI00260656C6|nr:hypothetical protein [Nitrosomonas sp.]MCW5600534.1 hypothetical protein [Nitrosomonas sp.]
MKPTTARIGMMSLSIQSSTGWSSRLWTGRIPPFIGGYSWGVYPTDRADGAENELDYKD